MNTEGWREGIQQLGHSCDIFIINADETAPAQLTHNDVFRSFCIFSHHGHTLASASNRNPERYHATDIFIAHWTECVLGKPALSEC